jgi:hypothetical protein
VALLVKGDGLGASSWRPQSFSTELELTVELPLCFVLLLVAGICPVSTRQVLDRFLVGDGHLFLTRPWGDSDSSGALLVKASESVVYTNKGRKNESEKHEICPELGTIQ